MAGGGKRVQLSWSSPAWRRFVLLVLPVLAFANTLRNGYHLDDFYRIVNNPHILELGNPWRFFIDPATSSSLPTIVQYRPMMPFTFALGRSLGGALGVDPLVSDHLGSLAFHAVTVFLAFGWLQRVLLLAGYREELADRIAGWAVALYAVHPVVGVPINYLCARDLLLMQMFSMGALNAWARYRCSARDGEVGDTRWMALALVCLAFAMLSKQNAFALPFVLVVFEWLIARRPVGEALTYRGPALFACVVAGSFAWTEWYVGFSDIDQLSFERKFWEYPATMAEAHPFYYLRNALWPFEMRMLPDVEVPASPFEPTVLLGAVFILATLGLAWRFRQRLPVVCFAILAYWLMFAVTSSVRPFRYLAMDYRQVPSLPYLCLIASLGLEWARERWKRPELAYLLVAYFGLASVSINGHWKNQETLWGQAVRKGTRAQGHVNYGLAIKAKQPERALEHFAIALEEGENIFARINRGVTLFSMGRNAEALESMRKATEVAPMRGLTWYWLSRGHMMDKDPGSALAPALKAVEVEPNNARFFAHLIRVELQLGNEAQARERLAASGLNSPELAALREQLGGR